MILFPASFASRFFQTGNFQPLSSRGGNVTRGRRLAAHPENTGAPSEDPTMARTHKTAMIKAQMAEEAREEEARRMEAARLAGVMDARTPRRDPKHASVLMRFGASLALTL
ncbi:hypothetical protein GN244_ATG16852 [Phytophthora infestans]|uniref:Uncharacterized protein n=1 Tax=Phytophthora infestans TaxID=4787 RepID=A0A833SZW6_PHYIN|nr:hypothetical protein GN244_ATG16852 [Phytophthora infestans]